MEKTFVMNGITWSFEKDEDGKVEAVFSNGNPIWNKIEIPKDVLTIIYG